MKTIQSTSVIELDKSALETNLKFLRQMVGPDCKVSSVVKGNAYGHGIASYVPMAEECGVDHFSVFSAEEAYACKQVLKNPETELMIMGMIADEDLEWVLMEDISFFVFNEDRLKAAIAVAKKTKTKARIHIELDTGMNRTGFGEEDIKSLIALIKKHKEHLEIEGLCTHYAGAESIANHVRVQKQLKRYKQWKKKLADAGIKAKIHHTACSAATVAYPKTRMDMVRIGIMQYGYWSNMETYIKWISKQELKEEPLERVIRWKSSVMALQDVEVGEFIGYGTTFMATEPMRIATVPVGYAHGYSRSMSNIGRVIVNGVRTGVVGLVNMNMTIIDVSKVPDVRLGDDVILIGDQGEVSIPVSSFSELSAQLNYELLTRLPLDIPRVVV